MRNGVRKICKPNPYFVQFFFDNKNFNNNSNIIVLAIPNRESMQRKKVFLFVLHLFGLSLSSSSSSSQAASTKSSPASSNTLEYRTWLGRKSFPLPKKKLTFEIHTPFLSLNFSSIYELVYLRKNVADTVLSVNIQSVYLESVLTPRYVLTKMYITH